jgi:hypothetical protein
MVVQQTITGTSAPVDCASRSGRCSIIAADPDGEQVVVPLDFGAG